MFGLPTWLLIVPVLGFLILIHEAGHFLTAKRFGIKVTEFGFGFPPRLFGVRYGETIYSINWIPLGGFVRMVGEEDPTDPRSFAAQSVYKRALVLMAGSFMNLVAPVVIFTILFALPHDVTVSTVTINGVAPGSPAQEVGLRAGDAIIAVNGKQVDNTADLIQKVMARLGGNTELTVRRGSLVTGLSFSPEFASVETVTVVPRLAPPELEVVDEVTDPEKEVSLREARRYNGQLQLGDTMTQGAIGILIGNANAKIVSRREHLWDAIPMSFGRIRDTLLITKNGIFSFAAGGPDPGFAGPIGIAQVTGEVAKIGIAPIFELMALISISLGIVNILPIPALDGGRLMFVVLEWVRRGKRISPQREGLVHLAGFVVLLSAIVAMSYFDIVRLLDGGSFIR